MDCVECEEKTGEKTEIVYTNGKSESLHLCQNCQKQFQEGEFVKSVSPS